VQRLVRAGGRGIAAALLGGLVGAALTRVVMRLVMLVAGGDPSFTWAGTAFIALFYVVFLTPGAVALAWSRARWPLAVFGLGAVAIPVQATGIAQTDLEAVGPFSTGQWVVLGALFVGMAAVYALQAAIVYRVARSGGADRERPPAARPRSRGAPGRPRRPPRACPGILCASTAGRVPERPFRDACSGV
jgi:hypothetical protein